MGTQFNWQFEDNPYEKEPDKPTREPSGWSWWWLVIVMAAVAVLGGGWYSASQRVKENNRELKSYVQATLNYQQQAFLAGDGELFFDSFTNDSALRAAQLLPFNQEAWRAGYTVTNVEQLDQLALVNVTWTVDGLEQQRIFFYEQTYNGLKQRPSASVFWGQPQTIEQPWGKMVVYETDAIWADQFSETVSDAAAYLCGPNCPPLNLIIAPDYTQTAVAQHIAFPSPRIWGLDTEGQPSIFYWQLLQQQLKAYYAPDPIRFAVPQIQLSTYKEIAQQFMAQYPTIQIELVALETLPTNPVELLTVVDGAAITPNEQMLAAGLVYDLTYFANTDAQFKQGDFYEQMWQGAWWQGRMWFVPQFGDLSVIYYDPQAYQDAGLPEPSLRWTWQEMRHDAAVLLTLPHIDWGIADIDRDLLFSYAYNYGNHCEDAVTVRCNRRLSAEDATAALAFYKEMQGVIPDITNLAPIARESRLLTLVSPSGEGVALWVNEPIEYEHHFQQRSAGVLPFPGSDRFDGVTPLWIEGSVISANTTQPRVVWEWLKFISFQYPVRTTRLIPSRPSVAQAAQYWYTLPKPLDDAMRTAFPFARPVMLSEQYYFSDEQLTAVRDGVSPADAAVLQPRLEWFTYPASVSQE